MSELARVTVNDEESLRVVTVAGEVDVSNAESIGDEALAGLPNAAFGMVMDLTLLRYVDSAGIAVVFEMAERLLRRGQSLALVVPGSSPIRRSLEVTRIDEIAPIEPTLEAARARALPSDDERTA